jgi:chromosome segregation ATPase
MAGKKSVIETGVDKLVRLVSERKKISVKDAAKELGVSVSSIEEWADFLEDEGIISIQTQFATVYLLEKKIGKKELAEKVAGVRDEKEALLRDLESSVNAIQRDSEELKLMDTEFNKIKSLLEGNFTKLSGKLDKLEDFRKSHHGIEVKHHELEQEYGKKLDELDSRLKKEQATYKEVMAVVEQEIEKIRKEQGDVLTMKVSEKQLQSKVDEINRLISSVKCEIDKGNEQLRIDDERLHKTEQIAKTLKSEIESGSKELSEISVKMRSSCKELDEREKEFMKDIESLDKGELEKIGAYKESRQLVDKFKQFFSQTKEMEDLIVRTEKEEETLKQHYENLVRKAKAFSVLADIPEVKQELDGLKAELVDIEQKKGALSSQLKKLRNMMRAIVK